MSAIVHRDYSILGSDIKIAIFDDMVEITNPGTLIIDKEKLGLGYSELRNQNLGNLFKKLELIEQWGTGYEKISQDMQLYPEIKLEIDDDSTFIQVKFIKIDKIKTTQETTQEIVKLTTRAKVIKYILQNKDITREELADLTGVSANAIKQHLSNLKKDKIIQRVGSTKSGYWEVVGG